MSDNSTVAVAPFSGDDIGAEDDPARTMAMLQALFSQVLRGTTPWRVAKCLLTLRDEVNAMAPSRKKDADGTIGDAAHQTKASDHNPWVHDGSMGVVTALDITHDPANGCDCKTLSDALNQSRDPRIKYVIWNRQIFSATVAPWMWRPYTGISPHTEHVHVSVVSDQAHYDDATPWSLT